MASSWSSHHLFFNTLAGSLLGVYGPSLEKHGDYDTPVPQGYRGRLEWTRSLPCNERRGE